MRCATTWGYRPRYVSFHPSDPLSSSWKFFLFRNIGVFISIVLTPHLGFDRIMAILCQTQSIRDVIAFPKTASGTDLLFKSPAPVTPRVLEEYGIAATQLG
jgi:tRNA synthetases class II (D, K and N)